MKKKMFGILLFIIFLLIATKVQASNASISISPTNPKVGDNVVVTVSATNVNTATIYAEVSGIISDTIKLVDGSISGEPRNFSTSKTYKCNSEGVINVKTTSSSRAILKGADVDVSASATAKVVSNGSSSNSGNSSTSTTSTKSNNANLKDLGIRPKEYDFKGFRYGKTKYDVTVPYEVETVEVYAKVEDTKAKLTGTGNKKLKEGTNVAEVVVTAEDGTKKTYTINIVRNSETNEVVPNVPDEKEENVEKLRLTAIALQNDLNLKLSPIFDSEIFEYTVEIEEELEKLEVSGIPNINSAIVRIEGNNNLGEENNVITLTVSADGYEDVVYKIKVLKNIPTKVEEKKETIEATKDELDNSNVMTRNIVICAVAVLLIIFIIIVIILKARKKGKKYNNSYYEDDYYNKNNEENSSYDNNETKENEISSEDYETSQGYTAEIETDDEYEDDRKRRKGRGKHF